MKSFPDESMMERSKDGSEPIRGGSIGLNRILNLFVTSADVDHKPRFNAIVISAFTIFRNIHESVKDPTDEVLEELFIRDVKLLLDYYDTYLSFVWSTLYGNKFCPVIIYFPNYKYVPFEIRLESTGKRGALFDAYTKFISRYGNRDSEILKMEHCRCFTINAGDATYPHKEVARKFREITEHPQCLYSSGDPIALMTNMPLDYHISSRLRGIQVLESYTARVRTPGDFRLRLDKEGRIPFLSVTHAVFGDGALIKPMVSPKIRKKLLEDAEKDKWLTRSEEDIRSRISKAIGVPVSTLRKYDFI